MIVRLLAKLIEPKSKDEDAIRRERILNILIVGTIALSTAATLLAYYDVVTQGSEYPGVPIEIITAITLTFLALYFFSRASKSKLVTHVFIWSYLLPAFYTSYRWGIDTPQAMLAYALVIVMSGILVNTKFAFIITMIISGVLVILMYLQLNVNTVGLSSWSFQPLNLSDIVVYSLTLGVIATVSWLFNREIEKALRWAQKSEKALKRERDSLEIKVEKRTEELKRTQLEKILHLYRLADFGRMTAGLFHDLVNPLTMVSLNLERLQAQDVGGRKSRVNNTKKLVGRAVSGTKHMEEFVKSVRKQIQKQEVKKIFSLNKEISQAIKLLDHKARKSQVKLYFVAKKQLYTYGNPLRFNQLVTNLVTNAIDACEKLGRKKDQKVIISLLKKNSKAILIVQDFGCGIPKKNIKKVFDPFFTTKSIEKGTGIGLSICKNIVEKELEGKIEIESKEKQGTTFTVRFPFKTC